MRSATIVAGGSTGTAVVAGVVTAVVGFTSAFAVVLTGLRAVGASSVQASSGLFIVCVTMGLGCILFSLRYRRPITMAWSTPGAALLAAAAVPAGGFDAAVGAFVFAGFLYVLTGLVRPLGRWVAAIPNALANAMLAGVLLLLCLEPFRAVAAEPAAVGPVLVAWLLLMRVARRWAVPGAFLVALVVIVVSGALSSVQPDLLVPQLTWTTPRFDVAAMVAIGLPLYLVTMTSQNIPGAAVLASFGYQTPMRPALTYAGMATVATAGLGGYSINLAAISAALAAGPSAHPDPGRRWVAGVSTGVTYLAFGPLAAAVAAVAVAAPAGIIAAIAGLALLGAFGSAARSALSDDRYREAAALTFVVAASGLVVHGIGAAFWALVAGGLYLLVMHLGGRRGVIGPGRRDRRVE